MHAKAATIYNGKRKWQIKLLICACVMISCLVVVSCPEYGKREYPKKKYKASLDGNLLFLGVNMLSSLRNPLQKIEASYHSKVNVDDEVGVAFVRVRNHPSIPQEWRLNLKDKYPKLNFLSPRLPNGSYDMLVHEVDVYVSFYEGYREENVAKLLTHAMKYLTYSGYTVESITKQFVSGNDISVDFYGNGITGLVALAHFEDFVLFIMKVTDSEEFFG